MATDGDYDINVQVSVDTGTGTTTVGLVEAGPQGPPGNAITIGFTTSTDTNYGDSVSDQNGYVVGGARRGDWADAHGGPSAHKAQLYKEGAQLAKAVMRRHGLANGALTRYDYLGLVITGQSFSIGQAARIPLSLALLATTAFSFPHTLQGTNDVYMMGNGVRPASLTATTWGPQGGSAVLQPMNADGQGADTATIAARAPAGSAGENILNGFANAFATKWAANPSLPRKTFVCAPVGVGGQTIEQLSKNANALYYNSAMPSVTYPDIFNRWPTMLDNFVAQVPAGKTKAILLVLFDQGQANYDPTLGGTQDRATYKTRLKQYIIDVNATIRAKTGQEFDPFWIINQTSGNWIEDDYNLSISMAQLELCQENPGLITMCGPTSDVTDNRDFTDGHLTSNGYRWVGERMARAAYEVIVEGNVWESVAPSKIRTINEGDDGGAVYITMTAPNPPLQLYQPFNGLSRQAYTDYCFRIYDNAGEAKIMKVQVIGASCIKITTDRPLNVATTMVLSGDDAKHNGNTAVQDSCPTPSYTSYYWSATPYNMPAGENITELVGKPYPSNNPQCLFYLPGTWDRS